MAGRGEDDVAAEYGVTINGKTLFFGLFEGLKLLAYQGITVKGTIEEQ